MHVDRGLSTGVVRGNFVAYTSPLVTEWFYSNNRTRYIHFFAF